MTEQQQLAALQQRRQYNHLSASNTDALYIRRQQERLLIDAETPEHREARFNTTPY